MNSKMKLSFGVAAVALGLCAATAPAAALTMQECSAKYKAARDAGTLGDQKWNDFRKSQCGDSTGMTAAEAPKQASAKSDAKPATADAKPAASGTATYPTAVSPKYANDKASTARMKTCLDQYNANKDKSENGGMKWIQKGGGYYSECNKRLKT